MKDVLRELGPYLLTELLLPGGTLIALALWLYRRRKGRKSGRKSPPYGQVEQAVAAAPRH